MAESEVEATAAGSTPLRSGGVLRASRMLAAIEAMVIPAMTAKSLVQKLRSGSERRHPEDEASDRQDRVADRIIRRYSKLTAVAGAASALPGVIPGVGTVIAAMGGGSVDAVSAMKLQLDMCRCLAECYGHDLASEDENRLTMLLAFAACLEEMGGWAAADIATKAGGKLLRHHLKGAAWQTVKHMLGRIGILLTKKGLAKGIPFGVGMAFGAGVNYTLTRYVGRRAKGFFQAERDAPPSFSPAPA